MKKLFTLMLMSICMVLTANAQDTYVVAGVKAMMGTEWNGTDTNNQMTSSDGVNYTLVKEGVTLETGIAYDYKIVKNGTDWYPDQNQQVTVEATGIYTITFTYNVNDGMPTATATKTGDAEATKHTYSVIGSFIDNWVTDFDMTESPEGTWTVEITGLAAGNYQFKVRADKEWSISYPSSNSQVTVAEDNTTVTIVFVESTKNITVTQTVATSIDRVNAEAENAPAYNLAGVKASKGLVIKNNKKYILR